jgi:hypothetical protein
MRKAGACLLQALHPGFLPRVRGPGDDAMRLAQQSTMYCCVCSAALVGSFYTHAVCKAAGQEETPTLLSLLELGLLQQGVGALAVEEVAGVSRYCLPACLPGLCSGQLCT